MIYRRNAFWRVLLVGLFVLVNTPAAGKAEPEIPTLATKSRPDMAAMAAIWADNPALDDPGMTTFLSMGYIAGSFGQQLVLPLPRQRTIGEFDWLYSRMFLDTETNSVVRVHLEHYSDETRAAAAMGKRSMAPRWYGPREFIWDANLIAESNFIVKDEQSMLIAEHPAQYTGVFAPYNEEDGFQTSSGSFVDVSFQSGRLVAGVALEEDVIRGPEEPAPAIDPAATPDFKPSSPNARARATELAELLAQRIETVLAGHNPAGADLALGASILPTIEQPPYSMEGYFDPTNLVILGRSPQDEAGARSVFSRIIYPRDRRVVTLSDSFSIHVTAITFASPSAAQRVVEAPRAPRSAQADSEERIEISGADVAIEDAASPYSAEIDPVSYSLDISVDGVLISMSAFALGSFDEARVATRELARFQARCLRLTARCSTTPFPDL